MLISEANKLKVEYINTIKKIKMSKIKGKSYWLKFYSDNLAIEKQNIKTLKELMAKMPDKEIEVKDLNAKTSEYYKKIVKTV